MVVVVGSSGSVGVMPGPLVSSILENCREAEGAPGTSVSDGTWAVSVISALENPTISLVVRTSEAFGMAGSDVAIRDGDARLSVCDTNVESRTLDDEDDRIITELAPHVPSIVSNTGFRYGRPQDVLVQVSDKVWKILQVQPQEKSRTLHLHAANADVIQA